MAARPASQRECRNCGTALDPAETVCPSCHMSYVTPTVLQSVPLDDGTEDTVSRKGAVEVLEGKWRLEGLVGEGGMGAVYLATDIALKRKVAIKMLSDKILDNEEFLRRFEREAQAMAQLDHPNLLPIYAVGRHKGRPFMVMKYLEGESLETLLLRLKRPMMRDEALKLSAQICSGLDFLHEHGVVHRDLKPGNIFIDKSGRAVILDFGLVRLVQQRGMTQVGFTVGTPGYMSPEQIVGEQGVDRRSDIYSLGVIFYEAITGKPPFLASSDFELMIAHRDRPVPDASTEVPAVPRQVSVVLSRALGKRPNDRFQTASEFDVALREAYSAAAGPSTEPAITRLGRRRRRLPAALALGATGLVAAAIVTAVFMKSQPASKAAVAAAPQTVTVAPVQKVEPPPQAVEPPPPTEQRVEPVAPPPKHVAEKATREKAHKGTVAPPTKAPLGMGKIVIVAKLHDERRSGTVAIDGVRAGDTGQVLDAPAGDHVLTITVDGAKPKQQRIHLNAGETLRLAVPVD